MITTHNQSVWLPNPLTILWVQQQFMLKTCDTNIIPEHVRKREASANTQNGELGNQEVLSFPWGKWPLSGSGESQKGQPGPRIRVHEGSVRGKDDQETSNVKIEAMGSLGHRGVNSWQEIKALKGYSEPFAV